MVLTEVKNIFGNQDGERCLVKHVLLAAKLLSIGWEKQKYKRSSPDVLSLSQGLIIPFTKRAQISVFLIAVLQGKFRFTAKSTFFPEK